MSDPPWRALVEDLTSAGFESPYLDQLRGRLDTHATVEGLEREIVREMAAALSRAEEKIVVALLELEVLGRGEDVEAYEAKREEARQALHDFQIHREALGLRHHDGLEQLYPVPPARRSRRAGGGR